MNQSPRVTEHGVSSDGRMYCWAEIRCILETLDQHANPPGTKRFDKTPEFVEAANVLEVVQAEFVKETA